ncbi:photosynthetic protein synthase I [Sulfuriferula plumbiphila]|uniref:Photosynthetic protein synthase I n=2 Tax=Sulfuriferula plumbiphila TaxID=171865 RepID=A0A512L918_9PROT|nr:photosynthetic protein synthase I [Sulfuriferula plumbiphila]GEP30988.1 photosynthetic protein synthase I [Sulfuriferula plumbiphila]
MASVIALFGLTACQQQEPWALDNITGLMPKLEFGLTNDTGQAVTAAAYHGKLVLLYFGYTHCPDVCPTTLATLAQAVRGLGADADKVRVLFVTVDPVRDTTQVLRRYATAFGPEFIGLRGNDDALDALTRRYRVVYSRDKPDAQGNYAVNHSSAVFIFDNSGKARLLGSSSSKAPEITQDLRRLLASD